MLYVWEAKKFEHRHEEDVAKQLVASLRQSFSNSENYNNGYLIFSPSICGAEFDALLLTAMGFFIVEFKTIKPHQTFSATENKWLRYPEGEEMHGGNWNDAGPFSQVKRYRESLNTFLGNCPFPGLQSPIRSFKSYIKGLVVVSPNCPQGLIDKVNISNEQLQWFHVCRPSQCDDYFRRKQQMLRNIFADEDLRDVIQEKFGLLIPTKEIINTNDEEIKGRMSPMSKGEQEKSFEKSNTRNREKKSSKRYRRLEKENKVLKEKLANQSMMTRESNATLDLLLSPWKYPDVKKMLSEQLFVGIDFGTSNTTVTLLQYNEELQTIQAEPLLVRQEGLSSFTSGEENHIIPTVLAWDYQNNKLVYGQGVKKALAMRDAQKRYREGVNVWREFKMAIGTQESYPQSSFAKDDNCPSIMIKTPEDAAFYFFQFLKKQIDEVAKKRDKTPEYVFTVPASFELNQRDALRKTLRRAGIILKQHALLDEPNAAFFGAVADYLQENGKSSAEAFCRNKHILVFDFGAGTCDISLLRSELDYETETFSISNLAISHFTALGGRNIDREIAESVLFPCVETHGETLRGEVKDAVVAQLCHMAEELKIAICKRFSEIGAPFAYAQKNVSLTFELPKPFLFPYKTSTATTATLELPKPKIGVMQFAELMNPFCTTHDDAKKQKMTSIFVPIEDTLKMANVAKEEVDVVLLVGGSAKNPFVKEKLRQYFGTNVQIIERGDICSLVSRGAAVNSFYVNGLNSSLITPILGDAICISTEDNPRVVLVKAGSNVPQPKTKLPMPLFVAESGESFRIPFYVGQETRLLGDVVFSFPDRIEAGNLVELYYEVTAEKVLNYWICVNGETKEGNLISPITSETLSDEDLACLRAVRKYDKERQSSNGKPTLLAIKEIIKAHLKAHKYLRAAEYMRDLKYYYPNETNAVDFFVQMADTYEAAAEYTLEYESRAYAYKLAPDYVRLWYYLWAAVRAFGWQADEVRQIISVVKKCHPNDEDFLYMQATHLREIKEFAKARQIDEGIYQRWLSIGLAKISPYTLPRFRILAQRLGYTDVATLIAQEEEHRPQPAAKKSTLLNTPQKDVRLLRSDVAFVQ